MLILFIFHLFLRKGKGTFVSIGNLTIFNKLRYYYLSFFKVIVLTISCLVNSKIMLCEVAGHFILSVALPALAVDWSMDWFLYDNGLHHERVKHMN